MEKIVPGKFVSLIYDLYTIGDGEPTLVHQSDPKDPEKIIYGVTQGVIKPLEAALDGLGVGDEFDVVANADEAFGPYDNEQIVELDKDIFVVDGRFDTNIVAIGKYVPMMTADGYHISGLVLDITDDKVRLDFNHPLAGKSIQFKGSVLDVRDATDDEIHLATNPGGCCGGCGGNGGCGDNGGGCCGDNGGCCGGCD